jgi:hypothetical protein
MEFILVASVVIWQWLFLCSCTSLQYSTVKVHAALGRDWLRWQPLIVAVATPYWRDASWRVSWQEAMAMVANNYDQLTVALTWGALMVCAGGQ